MKSCADRHPPLYTIVDAAGLSHGKGMNSYMIMMAVRLMEMRRLLKDTGSVERNASRWIRVLLRYGYIEPVDARNSRPPDRAILLQASRL